VRAGIAFVVVVSAAVWVYAFLIADPKNPDLLADPAFPRAAASVCKSAKDEIRAAGLIGLEARTPQSRADITERADAILATMVRNLQPLAPTTGEDAPVIAGWLSDWDGYLADRASWIAKLRAGEDAPFLERSRPDGGEALSKAMKAFADVNDMRDCEPPDNY
jgi:hypothetical protein